MDTLVSQLRVLSVFEPVPFILYTADLPALIEGLVCQCIYMLMIHRFTCLFAISRQYVPVKVCVHDAADGMQSNQLEVTPTRLIFCGAQLINSSNIYLPLP